MPVIVDNDTSRASVLATTIGHGSHVVSTVEQLESWLGRRASEYAVVLGPDVGLSAALEMANRVRLSRPALSVVLLCREVTTELMAQAMHAGVREIVSIADTASLRDAVERARQTFNAIHGPTAADANGGKVLTVFSPKGGVGKTTMAVNLALALCDNGTHRVCLVDLDLAFGDVAITLQMVPEHTISEAVEVEDHLDDSMLQKLLSRHDTGLMVLAAPTHPDAKDRISPALVRLVVATLRKSFDYVVIDTSPGFDDQVLAAFDETDETVVMATLDVPTVKNVKMSLETLDMLNLSIGHRWLVLNRADDEVGLTSANVEEILSMRIASAFPTSLDVANATNHGRPIVLSRPDHRVSRAIRALSRDLSTPDQEQRPVALAGTVAGKRRFSRAKK